MILERGRDPGRFAVLLLMLAAALAATLLRLPALSDRPMHADEAVLADKFGTLLEEGEYRYDPAGFHGPALLYLSLLPARLAGARNYLALSETDLRLTPALCGLLLVAAPFLLAPSLGWTAASWAALLLSVAPSFVYYSRYFIPETLLALSTAALVGFGARWLAGGGFPWAVAAGISAGIMLATKETAVFALAAAGIALAPWAIRGSTVNRKQLMTAAGAGILVAAAFYSSFGANPAGLWDFPRSYFLTYARQGLQPGPHVHPWHYYLGLLLWFRQDGGPVFSEALILAAAVPGVCACWRSGKVFPRFLVLYSAFLIVMYSLVPYKTPWCLLSFHFTLALLAGCGAQWLLEGSNGWRRTAAWVLLLSGAGHLAWQSQQAILRYSADPRNPWVYAHTTPQVFELRDRLEALAAAHPDGRRLPVQVFSKTSLWPLPWYFRPFPNVQWWNGVPSFAQPAPVILLTPDMEPALVSLLYESRPPGQRELYMTMFNQPLSLRPAVELRGFVSKSLWDLCRARSSPAPR